MKYFRLGALLVAISYAPAASAQTNATAPVQAPSPGDDAWNHINQEGQQISEDLQKHDVTVKTLVPGLQGDLTAFLAKYPNDAHAPEAQLMQAQLGDLERGLQLPGAPTPQQSAQQFDRVANESTVAMPIRAQASVLALNEAMHEAMAGNTTSAWATLDAKIDAFAKNFASVSFDGKSSIVAAVREQQIELLKESGQTADLNALLAKLDKDPNAAVAAVARQEEGKMAAQAELKTKPLDLKFTSIDGHAIDLAKMRGKVVLVDFWATWCGPCRGETPDVVAAYKKYHGQGFEIVGISLDQDKGALQQYTQQNGMKWPQYFDGKGWDNAISSHFGIQSIPAMWLIGKNGRLVTTEGRQDLDGQIAKLLAAKNG